MKALLKSIDLNFQNIFWIKENHNLYESTICNGLTNFLITKLQIQFNVAYIILGYFDFYNLDQSKSLILYQKHLNSSYYSFPNYYTKNQLLSQEIQTNLKSISNLSYAFYFYQL